MKKLSFIAILALATVAQAQTPTPTQSQTPATVPPAPLEAPKVEAPKAEPAKPAPQAQPAQQPAPVAAAPVSDVPSLLRAEPTSINARLGAGLSFGPGSFWMDGALELQLDKFVALGPKLQYGNSSSTDFIFGSIGPRFTVPMMYFEFGFGAGFGFAYRNVNGFEFNNFLYNINANIDFYILENLSLGLGFNGNFLSANAETYMSALTAGVTAHF